MTTEEQIVRYTAIELDQKIARGEDRTDWERIKAMTDDEVEASVDHEDEGEFDWSNIQVGMPPAKQQLTVRFDLDVVEWFRSRGPGYQTRMNQVLRSYVDAHRGTSSGGPGSPR